MTKPIACPGPEDLRQFALGLGDEGAQAQIEAHIARCATCLAAVGKFQEATDPVLTALRRAREGLVPEEPAVRELMERLSNPAVNDAGPTFEYISERPGVSIGPYKLLEQIGEGGFGVVFMAEQQQPLRRKVALKVIKPGMDTRQVVARFEAERQALALMEHPNIARVLDGGETQTGRPYFVMELVRGQPITKFCDDARLSTRERLALFVDVCRAVQHAHQKGIIHRDLKPNNVLVTLHGDVPVVKVIDFGVAKATGEQLTEKTLFTGFAQFVGTPLYMSPEQAALSGLDIDTRSDVYSLGVLLYELLTGSTPLRAERLKKAAMDEVRRLICDEEPERPSTRISSLGDSASEISARRKTEPVKLRQVLRSELDWIVLKALEKDRARRYETVNGLALDVQRYLSDEPVSAAPPSTAYRLTKTFRRHRTAILAVAAIAGAIVLGLVGTSWQAIRATLAESALKTERDTARGQTAKAITNLQRAEKAERELKDQLWQSYFDQAQARRWSGRPGRRFESLEAIKKAAAIRPSLELRNEAIAALALMDLQATKQWPGFIGTMSETTSIFVDGGLEQYSRSNPKGTISVRRVADDQEIVELEGPGTPSFTQLFSPDGRLLAVNYHPSGRRAIFRLWQLPSGKKIFELQDVMVHRALDFHPDSSLVALGRRDGSIGLYSTKDGTLAGKLEIGSPPLLVRFDPTGKRIAIIGFPDRRVEIREVASDRVTATLPEAHKESDVLSGDLAWHPHGHIVAVGAEAYLSFWDAAKGTLEKKIEAHPRSMIDHLEFSNNGDLLVTTTWTGDMGVWDAVNGEKALLVPNVKQHGWGQRFKFRKDDRLLGYDLQPPNVRLWEVACGRECLQLKGTGAGTAVIHPGGRLAVVTDDEGLRLWDLDTLRCVAHFVVQGCRTARFDPAGSNLVLARGRKLQRWPLKFVGSGDELKLEMGPPADLRPGVFEHVTLSADGKEVILAGHRVTESTIIELDHPERQRVIGFHPELKFAVLSPDKEWLATSTWHGSGVKIWHGPTGELRSELPGFPNRALVEFSPNGQWLATSDETGTRLWQVPDWSAGRLVETSTFGFVAFSPDNRLLAFNSGSQLKLFDLTKSKVIATLNPPDQRTFGGLGFSADSSRLAVSALGMLQVWDLRAIRKGLAELNLDWDLPPYPAPAPTSHRKPIEVTILPSPPRP